MSRAETSSAEDGPSVLRIEEDLPDAHRLTLVGTAWPRRDTARRVALSTALAVLAVGFIAVGFADPEALLFSIPFGLLVVAGLAGVQPEHVSRIDVGKGELRVVLHGRWIWGTRQMHVTPGQLTKLTVLAHDVSPKGPDDPELGLQVLANRRRLPNLAIEGIGRHDEVIALAHRIALALSLTVRTESRRYGLTCILDQDGEPPTPPNRISAAGYRGASKRAPLEVSGRATYQEPNPAPPSLEEVNNMELLTPVSRHDGQVSVRGERPYGKLLILALFGAVPASIGAALSGQVGRHVTIGGAALLGLLTLWMLAPPVADWLMAPATWLLGLRQRAFPSSPRTAPFCGGAFPDSGGVMVRRALRLVPCSQDARVFLLRRVPPRRSALGGLPLGACWSEVWIRDRGRWALLAKARRQEPSIAPSIETIAHEAARRLDTPVRFGQQRG